MSNSNKSENTEILYYNISIDNTGNNISGKTYGNDGLPINAFVSANNNTPLVEKPEDYYGSIVRMEVPAYNIPLVNIQIKTPINTINDINTMINSFTLTYGTITNPTNTSIQSFLEYTPQLTNIQPPNYSFPAQVQQYTPYYFVYSYDIWITMMNTALSVAMQDLKSQVPAISSASNPFFYFDAETQLISLYCDANFFNQASANYITIYFNTVSSQFFNGFVVFQTSSIGSSNGCDDYFQVINKNGLNTIQINSVNYLRMTQEFVSLAYLSPLKSVVLSTNMNVISEVFYINNPSALQNNNYISVLTDFLPDISGVSEAGIGSKIFIYNAQALWRIFQFVDRNPLYNFSLRIYWSDLNNNYYPLELVKGTQCNVKLMLIRKDLYNPVLIPTSVNQRHIDKNNDDNPRQTGFPEKYFKQLKI